MTFSQTVAYSELTRVLPWSLRALGYPFGTADRGAHVVATAAALEPGVLRDVAAAGRRPGDGFHYSDDELGLVVQAGGVSMLEVGPAAMDRLAAHAEQGSIVSCRILGATETCLLPAVLLTGAQYGMSSVATTIVDREFRWFVLHVQEENISLFTGADLNDLRRAFEHDAEVFSAIAAGVDMDEGSVILATARTLHFVPSCQPSSPSAKLLQAFSGGIPIAPEILRRLYELEEITWAPTSERSRTQAGFKQTGDAKP